MFASNRTSSVPHGRASTDINLDGSYKSYVMLCVIDLFSSYSILHLPALWNNRKGEGGGG